MTSRQPSFGARARRALAALAAVFALPVALAQQPLKLELCVACHGPQGNSTNPKIPSLAGQPKIFIENQLVLIREGLRDIPQMKGLLSGLKDADLVVLATYFSAQTAVPMTTAVNGDAYRRGQTLAHSMLCGTCHLPDYSGRQQIPRLAGQHEPFLFDAMKQLRDHAGPGRDTIMSASLYGLKDADLADLAHFLANFR